MRAGLQQLFRSIDADNSGTITVDEMRTALGQINGGRLTVRLAWHALSVHRRRVRSPPATCACQRLGLLPSLV